MFIYFALLIPIILGIGSFILFHHKITWWEGILPIVTSFIFIFGFKACVQKVQTDDIEYRGSIIVKAEYYEAYETYVHRMCSRTYKCGKSTCTTWYDCSYCDYTSAKYVVYDNQGNSWNVDLSKWNELLKKWKDNPKFIELDRKINYHGGCGKDGDMYYIEWDNDVNTSESAVRTYTYENRIQAAHSAFKFKEITKESALKKGLYNYPNIKEYYKQNNILGLDTLKIDIANKNKIYRWFEYLNGNWGPKAKVKIFVLLFYDKPLSISYDQEAYWDGGNDNELVICIGLNKKTLEYDWIRCFSWSKNKHITLKIRDELLDNKKFEPFKVWGTINRNINSFKPRNFKEFNYLTVEPPMWAVLITYIITLIVTIGSLYWGYHNDIDSKIFKKNIFFHKD